MTEPRKISAADFTSFNEMLSSLLQSGAPLSEAVRQAAEKVRDPTSRNTLQQVGRDIEGGFGFRESVEKRLSAFPPSYTAMIQAGIEGGDLPGVLRLVAASCRQADGVRRKVVRALVYPLYVFSALSVFILIVTLFTLPTVEYNLVHMSTLYPARAVFMMGVVKPVLWALLLVLAVLILSLTGFLIGKRRSFLTALLPVFLIGRLPFIGEYLGKWSAAVFLRELRFLLQSGVSMVPALVLCAESFDLAVFREPVQRAARTVSEGGQLADAFRKIDFLPATLPIILTGPAEMASLSDYLGKMADIYEEDLGAFEKVFTQTFETIVIAVLGLIVGCVLAVSWRMLFSIYTVYL